MSETEEHAVEVAAEQAAQAPAPKGLRLVAPAASRWIDFPEHPGFRMLVRPLTSPLNVAAEARARRRQREVLQADPAHPAHDDMDLGIGMMFTYQAEALGKHLIEAWEGVFTFEGLPAPVNEATIAEVMMNPDISRTFTLEARRPLEELAAEGNGCGPTPSGSSATGPITAPAADQTDARPALLN